jgi:FkbM family methyltransferase
MSGPGPRLANAFLRYSAPFSRFRSIPALGNLLQLTSSAVVGKDSILWIQIEHGPAAGLWISLDPRTGKSVLLGEGEPRVQQALAEYLRPGMVFYDLGANIGFFSLLASRLVGSEGHVFSFEPDPILFLHLRQNLEHNGFRQAVAEERAVWNKSATLSFTCADTSESPDRALGHVSLEETEEANAIPIACVSLDDYCTSHPAPDVIRCDVQGAECEVFQGAANTLRQWHPIVVCEMHKMENHFALTRYFLDFGYTCYALGVNHVLAILA